MACIRYAEYIHDQCRGRVKKIGGVLAVQKV
jgi:hypothetical protein